MSDPFVITRTWAALISVAALGVLAVLAHLMIRGNASAADGPISPEDEAVAQRRRGMKALVIGTDGRASTSKTQAVLWTSVLLFALVFLLLWGRSNGCEGKARQTRVCREAADARGTFADVTRRRLQPEIYVLLGLPLGAAVAAKALTSEKVDDLTIVKRKIKPGARGVIRGLGEVMSNDEGQADLVDFQYFAFNLLALAFFLIEFLTHPLAGLPTIPRTLLAISGLSVGTYTAKKALEKDSREDIALAIAAEAPPTEPIVAPDKPSRTPRRKPSSGR